MSLIYFLADRFKTTENEEEVQERKISLSTEDPQRSTSMRKKWEQRIEKRRADSESDDDAFEVPKKSTLSRNASNKALAWEQRFAEKKEEAEKKPPPMRNMTLDVDAEQEPGLDALSKSELEQLALEIESEEVVSSPVDTTEPITEADSHEADHAQIAALVAQHAIEQAVDDMREESLAESDQIGENSEIDSFEKSEQVHSAVITSSSSHDTTSSSLQGSVSIDAIVVEEQTDELPTDTQTEEVSEDQVFDHQAEMSTPVELKTPDDLKTPDFAKGSTVYSNSNNILLESVNVAPVTKDEAIEPSLDELNDSVESSLDQSPKAETGFKSRNESGNNNTR